MFDGSWALLWVLRPIGGRREGGGQFKGGGSIFLWAVRPVCGFMVVEEGEAGVVVVAVCCFE